MEDKLLKDKKFQHILKFAPESQRELMMFELARYFDHHIVAVLDKVEKEVMSHKYKPHDTSYEFILGSTAQRTFDKLRQQYKTGREK